MTIEQNIHEVRGTEEKQRLPLSSKKKIPIKVYGIIILLLAIVVANILFVRPHEVAEKPNDTIDNYSLKPIDPIAENKSEQSPTTSLSTQDSLNKEIEAAKAKDFIERLQASQGTEGAGGVSQAAMTATAANHDDANSTATQATYSQDPNTAYFANVSQARPERSLAGRFSPQPYLIGQGKFIFATLSVAINSDLPGQVSAIVSQDIYGEQGRLVLIPRGSRLVGEYRSMLANNQSRLFVVWTRVIQPNGITVMIGSEGTDALGQAGMAGAVDYHFFARFGTATLISLIGAGASTVGVNPNDEFNSMAAYRQAVAQAMAQQANNTLAQTANIPPTVHVKQGERVVVFVNKDLDFSRVYR